MPGSGSSTSSGQNRNYVTNDGRASTFGRNLVQYIQNRLPYAGTNPDDQELNPKYKLFAKAGMRRSEALARASVSSSNPYNNLPIGDFGKDTTFQDVMYANVQDDKAGRLRDYRIMAAYSEVADALDEICDETINPDDTGFIAKLQLKNIDLTVDEKKVLDAIQKQRIDAISDQISDEQRQELIDKIKEIVLDPVGETHSLESDSSQEKE